MSILESRMNAQITGATRHALAHWIEQRAPVNGRHATAWSGLELVREDRPRARVPVVLEPCVCIVAQGRKRAYLGGEAYTYDPLQYLVVTVPLPIETEIIEASRDRPYLALRLHLQTAIISELLL